MKVAICTPVHGSPRANYTRCLAQMLIHTAKHRPDIEMRYKLVEGHLIQNRNALAADALKWGADFVLWIDADMVFPENALLALLAHDKPVVAANYPTRTYPPHPTAVFNNKSVYTTAQSAGLQEVQGVGLGLVLMKGLPLRMLGQPTFTTDPNPMFPGEDKNMSLRFGEMGVAMFVDHTLSQSVGHTVEHIYSNDVVVNFARSRGETIS